MKKIALHIIMPSQTSGPNTANRLLSESYLAEYYKFSFISQNFHAKGRINFHLIKDLRKQIEQQKPDLVHLSGMQSSGFHAVFAAKLAGCKNILVTIRGYSGDDLKISKFKKFIFNYFIEPLTLMLCDKFYTVCEEAGKKRMVRLNKKKYLGVIHNAAPKIKINSEESRKIIRQKYGFLKDDFVVGISGRMTFDKGIEYISKAILQIEEYHSNENIKFIFIGDGEYCDILRKRHNKSIENNKIFILGKMDNVIELLCGCDLFLFATLHENLSNSLLEAMAVGLPIIATNVGGNKEVIENNGNGFLIEARNEEQIIEKIKILYKNKDMREIFSIRSKEIIREKFSQEYIYHKIDQIYKKMLKI